MNSVARKAYSSIAVAIALSLIPKVDIGKTMAMGIGPGGYQGSGAVAMGLNGRIDRGMKAHGGANNADRSNGGGYPAMVAGVRG